MFTFICLISEKKMYNLIVKALAIGVVTCLLKKKKPVNKIVEILRKTSSHLFKFHGEVTMHLFLNDDFILPSKIDICVERKSYWKLSG